MSSNQPTYDDNKDFVEICRDAARAGYIESRCREYLDSRTYRYTICFDTGDYGDELELFAPVGSYTIQKIIDDQQDIDAVHLKRPAPNILPIKILRIENDADSYIMPSETLNIHAILPRAPRYQLEAIICEINRRYVIYMKHLTTNKWYYYQNNYTCEQLSNNLSDDINKIIESRSVNEQRRLIQSAHFLVSMIFHNAVKYIYKQEER